MRVPGQQYPIVLDLNGAQLEQKRPILLEHDRQRICAQSSSVQIVAGEGLVIAGQMLETESAQYVSSLADQGFEWQASVGVTPLAPANFIAAGKSVEVNGQQVAGPVLVFKQWKLGECSFVAMGADSNTSAQVFPIAASAPNNAFPYGVPVNQLPAIHTAKDYNTNQQAIECALLRSINCGSQTEKQYSDEINSAADSMAGITLHGVMARAITAAGGSPVYEKVPLFTRAIETINAAAPSTVSLPKVFANVLQKALLAQMNLMPTIHRQLSKVESAQDFRERSFVRMSGVGGFQVVSKDGELTEMKLVDQSYEAKLKTFGNILGLTRTQMVNDDLGAFAQLPEIFGRAAMLACEQEFFRVLLGWFNSTNRLAAPPNTHPMSGLTTADFDLDPSDMRSLEWALQFFRNQSDAQGSPILTVPRFLAVPTSLEIAARKCMAQITANTSANANVMAGMFEVLVSPMFNSEKIPGASFRNWHLFADPAVLPAIILLFLNGQQSPTFESSEMEFSVIGGMRWRGYWDFSFTGAERQAALQVVPTT